MSLRVVLAAVAAATLAASASAASLSSYGPSVSPDVLYELTTNGTLNETSYAVYFTQLDATLSSWHDIPLFGGNESVRFVAEIPKNTRAKYEAETKLPYAPIKQDVKNGSLRFYGVDILWNYGFLPQTWEDSTRELPGSGLVGGNDPVDVVEIGSEPAETGGVYDVRPIGAYALIGPTDADWKVIAVRLDDPLAETVFDLESLEEALPGELDRIHEWFRTYKLFEGGVEGRFGNDGRPIDVDEVWDIIDETHEYWLELKDGRTVVDELVLF